MSFKQVGLFLAACLLPEASKVAASSIDVSPLTVSVTPMVYSVTFTPGTNINGNAGDVFHIWASAVVFHPDQTCPVTVTSGGAAVCGGSVMVTATAGDHLHVSPTCQLPAGQEFTFSLGTACLVANPGPATIALTSDGPANQALGSYKTVASPIVVIPLTVGVTPTVYSVTFAPGTTINGNAGDVFHIWANAVVFHPDQTCPVTVMSGGAAVCGGSVMVTATAGDHLHVSPTCQLPAGQEFTFSLGTACLVANPGPATIALTSDGPASQALGSYQTAAALPAASTSFAAISVCVSPLFVGFTPSTYSINITPSSQLTAGDIIQLSTNLRVFQDNAKTMLFVEQQGTKMCEGSLFTTVSGGTSAVLVLQGSPCALSGPFSFNIDASALLPNPGPGTVVVSGSSTKDPTPITAEYTTAPIPASPSPTSGGAPFVEFSLLVSPLVAGVTPDIYTVVIVPSYELVAGDTITLFTMSPVFQPHQMTSFVNSQGTPVCDTSLLYTLGSSTAGIQLSGSSCKLSSQFSFNIPAAFLQGNPTAGVVTMEASSTRNAATLLATYTTTVASANPRPAVPTSFVDFALNVSPLVTGVTPSTYTVDITPTTALATGDIIYVSSNVPVFQDNAKVSLSVDQQGTKMCAASLLATVTGGTSAMLILMGAPCTLSGPFSFNVESSALLPNPAPVTVTVFGSSTQDTTAMSFDYATVIASPSPTPGSEPFVKFSLLVSPLVAGVTPDIYIVSIVPSYELVAGDMITLFTESPVFQPHQMTSFVDIQGTPVCESSVLFAIGSNTAGIKLNGASCKLSGPFSFTFPAAFLQVNPAPGVVSVEGSSSKNNVILVATYTTAVKVQSATLTPCQMAQASPMPGRFIPECGDDGSFLPMQCDGSIGYCWCVDSNGAEIPDTRKRAGPKPMTC